MTWLLVILILRSMIYLLHYKKLQRILQWFTVKLPQRTTISAIYSELLLFFYIYFLSNIVFLYSIKCYDISAVVGMFFPYRHVGIIWSQRRHGCRHNLSFKIEWNTLRKTVKTIFSFSGYTRIGLHYTYSFCCYTDLDDSK